jgi:hypothetical protein
MTAQQAEQLRQIRAVLKQVDPAQLRAIRKEIDAALAKRGKR